MKKFYSFKTLLKMVGECIRSIPHISPWIRPWLYNNKRWPQILRCFQPEIPKAVKARLL